MSLFLEPAEFEAWEACPGRPAMEWGLAGPLRPMLKVDLKEAQGEVLRLQRLEVGLVTGERGATVVCPAVSIETDPHARVVVYGANNHWEAVIWCLAAYIKYSLLHDFEAVHAGAPAAIDFGVQELHVLGARVTAAGHAALALRDSTEALNNLVAGPMQCGSCRAREECPEFAKTLTDGFPTEGELA